MKILKIILKVIKETFLRQFCKSAPLKVEIVEIGIFYYIRRNGSIVESSKTDSYLRAQENFKFVVDFENPKVLLTN